MYCLNGEKFIKCSCCNHTATSLKLDIHKARTQISKFQIFKKNIAEANSSTIFTFSPLFISIWNGICHKSGSKSGCEHSKTSFNFCDLYEAKAKFNSKRRQQKTIWMFRATHSLNMSWVAYVRQINISKKALLAAHSLFFQCQSDRILRRRLFGLGVSEPTRGAELCLL